MSILGTIGTWLLGAARENGAAGMALREAAGSTFEADEEQWRRLTADGTRDLMPLTQDRMREVARYLWEQNLLGNRLIELPLAYLLAEGVEIKAADADMQKALERFWNDPINSMDIKLPKKVRELALYGEQCWPAFVNEVDGHVRLGYLDPALIASVVSDPDNPEQAIGIVTVRDRKGVSKRYRVIVNGPESEVFTQRTAQIRETFADGECFWFTINDLSNGMRGRSDLLAEADWIDAYDTYLIGEMEGANHRRAFVWDVTLTGANQAAVDDYMKKLAAPAPSSVRVHNESEVWNAVSPTLNAADAADMARLFRNHALGGGTIPEHWFGGGGDVNRAVGAEMGEPTFKILSMRQRMWKHILETVFRYQMRQVLMKGGGPEPEWDDARLDAEAVFPELTARDTTKYASALQQVIAGVAQAVNEGYLTQATAVSVIAAIAGRLGVEIEPEEELKQAQAEAAQRRADQAAQDVFVNPAADPNANPNANPNADPNANNGAPANQPAPGKPGNMPKTKQPANA